MDRLAQLKEVKRAQRRPDQHHGQNQAEVTDPVDQERLFAGVCVVSVGVVATVKPEADQQEGCQSHAFPADEHGQEVVAEHQNQHGQHEEVQVDKVTLIALVIGHVAHGIEVDQRADARDHQHHGHTQRVDEQCCADAEGADGDPLVERYGDLAFFCRQREHGQGKQQSDDKGRGHRSGSDAADDRLAQFLTGKQVDQQPLRLETGLASRPDNTTGKA